MPSGLSHPPGLLSWGEAVRREKLAEERAVGQVFGRDAEVGIGRVLGDRDIGVAGVEVDGLSAHEYQRIEVWLEGIERVE